MLRLILLLLLLGSLGARAASEHAAPVCPTAPDTTAQAPLRVMSFNIRFNNPDDGEHAWPHRKDRVASMIRFHGADLVGVQEALKGQLDDLAAALPDYAWLGVGRDDGEEGGEFSAILYRTDRFDVLEESTFWLSETPEVPGSKSWDAAITRIVTWAQFRDRRTGDTFYLFNTHFDHLGEQAREESARLLTARIPEIAGTAPVIVTGDLNVEPTTEAYRIMAGSLQDAREAAPREPHGPEGTFSGFEVTTEPLRRIDYIFVNDDVRVRSYGVLSDQWQGRYPSDHLPVLAEVVIE